MLHNPRAPLPSHRVSGRVDGTRCHRSFVVAPSQCEVNVSCESPPGLCRDVGRPHCASVKIYIGPQRVTITMRQILGRRCDGRTTFSPLRSRRDALRHRGDPARLRTRQRDEGSERRATCVRLEITNPRARLSRTETKGIRSAPWDNFAGISPVRTRPTSFVTTSTIKEWTRAASSRGYGPSHPSDAVIRSSRY